MKKIFFTLAFIAIAFMGMASETDKAVPSIVLKSFQSTFTHAEGVRWETTNEFLVASFTVDEEKYSAYYYQDGSLAVVAQVISWKQLPRSLKVGLEEKAVHGHVLAIYKMESDEGIRYYCEIEKSTGKEILEAAGSKWKVVKK